MESKELISELAAKAKSASRSLLSASPEERSSALGAIASSLVTHSEEILAANAMDLSAASKTGAPSSMIDRLLLTADRVKEMADSVLQVAALPDPLGRIIAERTLANGLHLKQVSVPFGVVGMVYEGRPNVTVDAASILLKSGNTSLLRGSVSAVHSNEVLVKIMREALSKGSISPDVIQLVPSIDRSTVTALLRARGEVDLVIPRGSADLIRTVIDNSTVPTIETGAGVCHVYVDEFADLDKALPILINSKTDRPSVCNAAETLLIHEQVVKKFMPAALKALKNAGVIIHGDAKTLKIAEGLNIEVKLAQIENWSTEYNALEINVAIVPNLLAAAEHIQKYGTQHTEAIVTESEERANQFIALADCAAIMVNASTRFTDGEQMGFGAEIGISNQKLHARGPMGLEQMTTTTWIVRGNGQIR